MDKRTLIFIVSLSLTLFFVNSYFEGQREEGMKDWNAQQRAIKKEQLQTLQAEIKEKTVPAKELGVLPLYSDPSLEHYISSGIETDGVILAFQSEKETHDQVYSKKSGQPHTLRFTSKGDDGLLLYSESKDDKLPVGTLPYFGQFDLFVVEMQPRNPQDPQEVFLGEYNDGQFTVLQNQVSQLQKDLQEENAEPFTLKNKAIVLRKIDGKITPVAIYLPESGSLLHLRQIADFPMKELQSPSTQTASANSTDETYYVLENEYQQLVFSSKGAALAEINLPFETEKNSKSVVKEIEFDRDMVEYHPYNAMFPSKPYYTAGMQKHAEGKLGGYYPLLRRDLIEVGRRKSVRILPAYYGLNIVSEYPELAELPFSVKDFTENSITFEAMQRQRKITKTYTLGSAPYTFDVAIQIEGDARGLWLTTGVPEVEWISNAPAPALKYRITRKDKSEVQKLDLPQDTTTMSTTDPDWLANSNGFLGIILDPLSEIQSGLRAQYVSGTEVPSRLVEIDQEHDRFQAKDLPGYLMMLPLKGGNLKFRVFAGPFSENILTEVDTAYSNSETGYNPDYIAAQSYHGWFAFISAPFAKFLFVLMKFFHAITGSWGLSIILLTVALRIMLYPLNAWSTKSMIKMQEISPKVQKIQEKYGKKDPKKAQLEIMNLYRESGVNPVSGCFPILIQMPFLFGMFDLLKSSFALRGASFIPGWIDNLAAPDVLFSWGTPIPFIGNSFHLLPILLGVVMFAQQRMMSTLPKDQSQWTDQQRQQRTMGTMMAFFFTFMFYKFPSGLNIYWLSSMLLGILQQWWTQKRLRAEKKPA